MGRRLYFDGNSLPIIPYRIATSLFMDYLGNRAEYEVYDKFDAVPSSSNFHAKASDILDTLHKLINLPESDMPRIDDYTEFYIPAYKRFEEIIKNEYNPDDLVSLQDL